MDPAALRTLARGGPAGGHGRWPRPRRRRPPRPAHAASTTPAGAAPTPTPAPMTPMTTVAGSAPGRARALAPRPHPAPRPVTVGRGPLGRATGGRQDGAGTRPRTRAERRGGPGGSAGARVDAVLLPMPQQPGPPPAREPLPSGQPYGAQRTAAEPSGRAMRVLPLGTGLALTGLGLGLAFFGTAAAPPLTSAPGPRPSPAGPDAGAGQWRHEDADERTVAGDPAGPGRRAGRDGPRRRVRAVTARSRARSR